MVFSFYEEFRFYLVLESGVRGRQGVFQQASASCGMGAGIVGRARLIAAL